MTGRLLASIGHEKFCKMLWKVFDIKTLGYRLKKINVISALRYIGISMYQLLECSGNLYFSNTVYLCVSYDSHNKQRNVFDCS